MHTSFQKDQYCPWFVGHAQGRSKPCSHLSRAYTPTWHFRTPLDQTLSTVRTKLTQPCSLSHKIAPDANNLSRETKAIRDPKISVFGLNTVYFLLLV